MKKAKCGWFVFACVFVVHTLCANANDANTVATIDGKALSKEEFDRRYKENIKYFKFTPPTKANVLNDIIKFELGVQEAKSLGLHSKAEIQERMNTILYHALIDQELAKKFKSIEVPDAEVKSYCKKYPEIRTSHVYVPLPTAALKATETEAYAKINAAKEELKKGKSFEAVVGKYGEGYAVSSGGDIGFQTKDKLDPTYYEEAAKLNIGEMTKKPVRTQFGLHIVKLTGKRSCSDIDVDTWKRMLYDEKRAKILEDYLNGLRAKANVTINKSLIAE